jgi:large subunit ribosomal protein L4
MPKVNVVDLQNAVVGEVELADSVFAAEVNDALLYEAVRNYRAGLRSGTAATKVRGSVRGSGKKLWKQKGTGRARVGSVRSPLWRHGGTIHGPQPRDYSYHLPRKMEAGALRSALSAKLRDGELTVVREFALGDHKTKTILATLGRFESPKKVLFVEAGENRNLELGARNLQGVTVLGSRQVSVYHLLDARRVLISEQAAQKLSAGLDPKRAKSSSPHEEPKAE